MNSPPPLTYVPPPAHDEPWSWAALASISQAAWISAAALVAAAVWSLGQVEALWPRHYSPGWVLLLGVGLGTAALALTPCLRLWGRRLWTFQVEQTDALNKRTVGNYSCVSKENPPPGQPVPLSRALTESLLVSLLYEPLLEPSLPHIQALTSRLQVVSQTLERADVVWNAAEEDALLTDKVQQVRSYLQKRTGLLRRLHQMQGDLEGRLKCLLGDLEGKWAQLEELHTRATLTKHTDPLGPQKEDLDSVRKDTRCVCGALDNYQSQLQECQQRHKDSTQLLQELSWNHSHAVSHCVHGNPESVWPEMLLQSNIEQFDKVLQSFLSLEQQTTTFQAHLGGLNGPKEAGTEKGPLTRTGTLGPCSCSLMTSSPCSGLCEQCHAVPPECQTPSPSPAPAPALDKETPLTLCERSALQISFAIGHLSKLRDRK